MHLKHRTGFCLLGFIFRQALDSLLIRWGTWTLHKPVWYVGSGQALDSLLVRWGTWTDTKNNGLEWIVSLEPGLDG